MNFRLKSWDVFSWTAMRGGLFRLDNDFTAIWTDNVSLRFVVPACASNFVNGLKVVITLPSDYTIDAQVNISNFTLRGTYWRNGTGYNSNAITYDS